MTEPRPPKVVTPEELPDLLREMEWGSVNVGLLDSEGNRIGWVCPACGAIVAKGGPPGEVSFRENHILFHQNIVYGKVDR